MITTAAPGTGTLGSGVRDMLDAGAMTGGVGDSPGVCRGGKSTGWQGSRLETQGVGGGAKGRLLTTCATALPGHEQETVAVQRHQKAMEEVVNWVGWGGVSLNNGPDVVGCVIAGSYMTINW